MTKKSKIIQILSDGSLNFYYYESVICKNWHVYDKNLKIFVSYNNNKIINKNLNENSKYRDTYFK